MRLRWPSNCQDTLLDRLGLACGDPLINSSERCVRWRSGRFVGGRVYSVLVRLTFAQVR